MEEKAKYISNSRKKFVLIQIDYMREGRILFDKFLHALVDKHGIAVVRMHRPTLTLETNHAVVRFVSKGMYERGRCDGMRCDEVFGFDPYAVSKLRKKRDEDIYPGSAVDYIKSVEKERVITKRTEEEAYKVQAIKAARDLQYGDEVVAKIKNAKTDGEIARIMITARKERFGDE